MNEPRAPSSPSARRLFAAFAVLPFVDAGLAYVCFPAVWRFGGHGGFHPIDPKGAALTVALVVGLIGLAVTLFAAVPTVRWLMKRGPLRLQQLIIAGFALGNAPFVVYVINLAPFAVVHLAAGTMSQHLSPPWELLAGVLRALVIGSVAGMTSALVFWLVATRRRVSLTARSESGSSPRG